MVMWPDSDDGDSDGEKKRRYVMFGYSDWEENVTCCQLSITNDMYYGEKSSEAKRLLI